MSSNKILSLDLETYSDVDIENGVYRYVDTPNFEILLLAYAFDNEPVRCIDLCSGENIPDDVLSALHDKSIEKHAFNASFERVCLSKYLGEELSPHDNWWCTQAHAAMYGLPASLKDVAKALELDEQKDKSGTLLINYFSKPCKPTRTNGMRDRNYPLHDPMKWELFKKYCIQDVNTERAISRYLDEHFTKRLDIEKENYRINEEINDRGIRIDIELCKSIVEYNDKFMQDQFKRAQELTGLDNPNSLTQLKVWLEQRGLRNVDTITKVTIPDLIESTDDEIAKEVLQIRLNMSQTSITKYQKMLDAVCSDGRVHGVMKYYGANRTGRFSGRLIQTQNLPRNYMHELKEVRELVKNREWDYIESMYDDIPNIIKQLIRTAIIPSEGCVFGIADYSAIEARVSAWVAHEEWVEEVFRGDGKIYEATASQMFGVPIETISKGKENYELRQRGKVATLACIAEGTLVPTSNGLKPIEEVTSNDLVWDGESWVNCDGAIYQGEGEVIEYDGIKATEDHIFYTKQERKQIQFGQAAKSGSHFYESKPGWEDLWDVENNISREKIHKGVERSLRSSRMYDVRSQTMDTCIEPNKRAIKEMSYLRNEDEKEPSTKVARQKTHCCETTMHKPKRSNVQKLRRTWDRVSIQQRNGGLLLRDGAISKHRGLSPLGNRQDRYKRSLRAWKSTFRYKEGKYCESKNNSTIRVRQRLLSILRNNNEKVTSQWLNSRTDYRKSISFCEGKKKELENNKCKVRLYDIANAGRHHRYAISERGIIVHNCGYGGGVGAMAAMDVGHKIDPNEYKSLVDKWRSANPNIVRMWSKVENAAKKAITTGETQTIETLRFKYSYGCLFIQLPSKRWITYYKAHIDDNGSIVYQGNDNTRAWVEVKTFGGKLFENIIQAISRDCLADSVRFLVHAGFKPVFHVHDEIICELPKGHELSDPVLGDGLETMEEIMGKENGVWDKGLYHPAPGFDTEYYLKD